LNGQLDSFKKLILEFNRVVEIELQETEDGILVPSYKELSNIIELKEDIKGKV
ncbi:9308_t:CDS:1, partial [Dentiscutata erythropus]